MMAEVWDSPEFRTERDIKLLVWFGGNVDAVACFLAISNIAEVWDDFTDGEAPKPLDVDAAFMGMLIGLNDNRFFIDNRDKIVSALIITLNGWHDANTMVLSAEKDDRIKAYMLRNLGLELAPLFVYLTEGYGRMRQTSMAIRKYFNHETFDAWEAEHDISS